MVAVLHEDVPHVPLRSVRAGHVPTAPALRERAAMVCDKPARVKQRHARPLHVNRPHHQTRDAERSARGVALQALVAPVDTRLGPASWSIV